MSRIFISYRRGDTSAYAGRIYDRLTGHFGDDQVFMDVDTIEPGADFVDYIDEAVGSCDVLVAVIGRDWLDAKDADGRPRLQDPEDFVRLEVTAGLERDVRVIPVLVEGAEMPKSSELPPGLDRLARRNALEVSDTRWRHDSSRLIETVEKVMAGRSEQQAVAETAGPAEAPPPGTPAQSAGAAPPQSAGAAQAESAVAAQAATREAKRAKTALALGIASLALTFVVLGFLVGVPAMLIARDIKAGEPADRRTASRANTAFWLGLVGSMLSATGLTLAVILS